MFPLAAAHHWAASPHFLVPVWGGCRDDDMTITNQQMYYLSLRVFPADIGV